MIQEQRHYELVIRGNKRLCFIPHDLRYFDDHFVCERMKSNWGVPPAKIIRGNSSICDFVLWMLRAPIITERVLAYLRDYCQNDVEFLPFHDVKETKLFAVNVLTRDSSRMMFKKDINSVVYVNDNFGNLARNHRFSGIELADPTSNISKSIVQGKSVNIFPGLVS